MTNVRDLAINCTAKLYAFRKTREGVIVQFVLDPTEVPAKLQTDHIGTSYVMALCEIDDATGQPKGGEPNTAPGGTSATADKTPPRSPERQDKPATAGGARNRLTWESVKLCRDVRFQEFLREKDLGRDYTMFSTTDWEMEPEECAAEMVRGHCGVESRAEILQGTTARSKWDALVAEYELERVA